MPFNRTQNGPQLPAWAPLVLLLVVSVACVVAYSREGEGGPLHAVQGAASVIASPFQFAGAAVGAGTGSVGDALSDVTADASTLSALRDQNAELRELVAQAEEYRQEAQRLEDLLNLSDSYDIDGVTARVIGRSADAWNQSITISAGSDSGVDAGMTVMGPSGVVGQVIETTSTTATVRLLTDPQSGAAVLVQSSRAEGVVRGSLEGALYLQDVDATAEVSVGDVVVTSGLGGSYVRGLIVGTVVSVEGSAGAASRTIIVSPNETAEPLQEVIVVRTAGAADAADASGEDSDTAVDDTTAENGSVQDGDNVMGGDAQ